MFENQIQPRIARPVLADYEAARADFSWERVNGDFSWHETGKVNIAHEAIGRFAEDPATAGRTCLIYSYRGRRETYSCGELNRLANRFGNLLRGLGVGRGDRVFLFLPNIPELYVALAGCAKIGAVIVPLYAEFRSAALLARMRDAGGAVLVTTPAHRRHIPVEHLPELRHCILVGGQGGCGPGETDWAAGMAASTDTDATAWLTAEAPLFLIYTSGRDGSPMGLVHVHDAMRGYLMTGRWALDLRPGDVLWTQARPGWFMNVVYNAFAPWLCGAASFITGKIERAAEFYQRVQENRISVVYATPTLYRIVAEGGPEAARGFDLTGLRHLASVLEPLYPDLIYGILRILDLAVHDTWWTAETGMITIANFPCLSVKPGYMGKPVPGITAAVLDAAGDEPPPFTMGELALRQGWPAMARGAWRKDGAGEPFRKTGDWLRLQDTAFMDYDGYFYYQGRTDDVIITAAGKTGFSEIERALERHQAVREAAVIRSADAYGGKKIKAFVILRQGFAPSEDLQRDIRDYLLRTLAPDLNLAAIRFCETLPKDAGGRLMRRVLKALELGIPVGNVY